jgi:hypothetical protein
MLAARSWARHRQVPSSTLKAWLKHGGYYRTDLVSAMPSAIIELGRRTSRHVSYRMVRDQKRVAAVGVAYRLAILTTLPLLGAWIIMPSPR